MHFTLQLKINMFKNNSLKIIFAELYMHVLKMLPCYLFKKNNFEVPLLPFL